VRRFDESESFVPFLLAFVFVSKKRFHGGFCIRFAFYARVCAGC